MFRWDTTIIQWILLAVLLHPVQLFSQPIEKKDYVVYETTRESGQYRITYRFRDPFLNFQTYSLTLPAEDTDRMIDKFGIPTWLFDPYEDTPMNRELREREIAKGLFLLKDNTIEVDKNAVLEYYSATFTRPIAEMIVGSLADYGVDNRRNRIEFAMRFVQDIPYGVPEFQEKDRHFGGVHVPPQLLVSGYGDCDSKVLLFVGILSYLIPSTDIIFLNQKDHVLSAVRQKPEKGLTYVMYRNEEYLIAETAGPGLRLLGQKGNYYRNQFRIEMVQFTPADVIPYAKNPFPTRITNISTDVKENILVLRNDSPKRLQFQISPDRLRWESLSLNAQQSGRYIFDRREKVFLRFKNNRNKEATYQIGTGHTYNITWNERKKRWEISS